MKGINSVRLAPRQPASGVSDELRRELARAEHLRAGVGYWTVHHPDFRGLSRALGGQGYLCVDLSLPTSVDRLEELEAAGAEVYLHLERTTSASSWEGPVPRMPNGLMHTKLVLFDLPDDKASLWCGSHNWTSRGLGGMNIEASLVLDIDQGCDLYNAVASFLEEVRDEHCERFDPKLVEWYRWLQKDRSERTTRVVRFRSPTPTVYSDETVTLFGDRLKDLKPLPAVTDTLLVEVLEAAGSARTVYVAEVLDKGKLEGADPSAGGLTFDNRHHGFRSGRVVPDLLPKAAPASGRVATAKFYVTLHLLYEADDVVRTRPPMTLRRWDSDPERLALRRLDRWYLDGFTEDVHEDVPGHEVDELIADALSWAETRGVNLPAGLLQRPTPPEHYAAVEAALSDLDEQEVGDLVLKHVAIRRGGD